ncbi:MAG: hypothetical protein ACKOVH_12590, partial [Actinomycetota bacterium]
MSRSRRPGDDREEPGRSDADRESTRSFEEAEALFRAALDEVRGLQAALGEARSGPDADDAEPWAVRTPDRPASTRRRRTPPRTDPVQETTGVDPGEDRPGRRRRTAPTAISPGDGGSDGSGRWARRAAPVGGPPGVGDPDDLTGDLFEGRDRSGALPPTVTENAVVVDPASAAPVPAPAAAEAYAAVAAGIAGSAGAAASGSVDHVDAIDTAPRPGPRRRPGLVVAVAAGLAAALVLALLVLPGGGDDPALRTAPAARYTFPTTSTPEGAEVSRTWELRGADGDRFVGRLVLTNPRPTAVAVRVTETIPKAIAPSVQQIRFRPQPIVVQADPVVRYDVTIPAGGRFTAEYTTSVAPEGPRRARLAAWALLLTPPPTTPTPTPPVTAPPAPTPTPGPTTPRT